MMGDGHDNLKDVGGLGTAQRGTAAAMIVASSTFSDARILVVITMLNVLAIIFLIAAAKKLSADNVIDFTPTGADRPRPPHERLNHTSSGSTPARADA